MGRTPSTPAAAAPRVLVLAYHFPPIGGSGVQRNAKFVKYLPDFGWEPVIITGTGSTNGRWTPSDPTLADEIPPGTEVLRLADPEPAGESRWRARMHRMLARPSKHLRWWLDGAVHQGRDLTAPVDVVLASLAPYETAEAAARLAIELGRPWVADLQDPWALDELWLYPSSLHRRRDLARMHRLLGSAAAIVMNTPEARDRVLRELPRLSDRPVLAITSGFDPSDFRVPRQQRSDGVFRIVHTGYLYTDAARRYRVTGRLRELAGGARVRIDMLARSHYYLIEAVNRLVSERPDLAPKIEIHLAGVLSDEDREVARRSAAVRIHGYLPHAEATSLMCSADLLFLPLHDLPLGHRVAIVPGKTYEYLGSGRPILAAVPPGDARDLLLRAGTATVCSPSDANEIATVLRKEVERWEARRPVIQRNDDLLADYEWRRLTGRLAEVLSAASAGRADQTARGDRTDENSRRAGSRAVD